MRLSETSCCGSDEPYLGFHQRGRRDFREYVRTAVMADAAEYLTDVC